eukprot:CAMPEP_0203743026 /NCGR_PEP_ID=MMETSP0092-20131115/59223_1 /ASSEMBLY_ACC=CAM_ASM_001090 /TAXON_ID=426623 /ORGANISM="Chaetoceros affinis, Strain CCMP159" /LENGTH=90 /DNA_ID=CAMNT_0050630301 /DNA_START=121 /DNA_END=393 /DNA_ORIENTATION=-
MTEKKNINSDQENSSTAFLERTHWARKEVVVDEQKNQGVEVQKKQHQQQQDPSWARKAFIHVKSTKAFSQRRGSINSSKIPLGQGKHLFM